MIEYREILRLHSQGISQRAIAESLSCSRNTVAKVLQRAKELSIAWPLTPETTDAALDKLFYPDSATSTNRRLPDNEYIHKEMAKKGVMVDFHNLDMIIAVSYRFLSLFAYSDV